MEEFTAKVKITPLILDFIKKYAVSSRELPPLINSYWKSKSVDLKDFHPAKKVIRLRAPQDQTNQAAVDELSTFLKEDSYTHDRNRLFKGTTEECKSYLQKGGYEKWGEAQLRSKEYKIKLPSGAMINALEEELNGKKILVKFEAENEKEIDEAMKLLNLSKDDLILKNRAQLLAEEMELI